MKRAPVLTGAVVSRARAFDQCEWRACHRQQPVELSNRNHWQLCSGFSGNLFPERLATFLRNPHLLILLKISLTNTGSLDLLHAAHFF